jgi:hypothetical protein
MLLDGEVAELSRFCIELSAGRLEGRGTRFLLIIPFALGLIGKVFEFMAVLFLVHTGPQGPPGVIWNWGWHVYLGCFAGKN